MAAALSSSGRVGAVVVAARRVAGTAWTVVASVFGKWINMDKKTDYDAQLERNLRQLIEARRRIEEGDDNPIHTDSHFPALDVFVDRFVVDMAVMLEQTFPQHPDKTAEEVTQGFLSIALTVMFQIGYISGLEGEAPVECDNPHGHFEAGLLDDTALSAHRPHAGMEWMN